MKLLLVICLAVAAHAAAPTDRICCRPPNAGASARCTENIPRQLCIDAGGAVVEATPAPADGNCCCFAPDAGPSDRCIETTRAICLGVSVNGRCRESADERCCCRPAGVVNDLECVPRVPTPLCEKTPGAECVRAPTPAPTCQCTIGGVTRLLPQEVCTKFSGRCATAGVETCCCIFDGQTDMFGNPINPSPTDPGVPARGECIVVRTSACNEKRKRSGVCHAPPGGAATTLAPRCQCQDPAVTGFVAPILEQCAVPPCQPAQLLRHVCEEKLGSTCIVPTCCCKYPSAPLEACLPNIQEPVCRAVGGALCVATLAQAQPNAAIPTDMLEFLPTAACFPQPVAGSQLVRVTGTGLPGAFNGASALNNLGVTVPLFDLSIFGQQPTGNERVFIRGLASTVRFDLSPAAENFILGAVNLKGNPVQLPATGSVYTIRVVPTNALPAVFSGLTGGDGRRATFTPTGTVGEFLMSFSNANTVSGLIGFDRAVSSVEVEFPTPVLGAPVDIVFTSGFFASFQGPYTAPAAVDIRGGARVISNIIEGSGLSAGIPAQGFPGAAPRDAVIPLPNRVPTACVPAFGNRATFPSLPAPQLVNIFGFPHEARFEFAQVADDALFVHFSGVTVGAPIGIFQNDPSNLGFGSLRQVLPAPAANVGRPFPAPAADFIIQVRGRPSQIIIAFDGTHGAPLVGFSLDGVAAAETLLPNALNDLYNGIPAGNPNHFA